MSYSQTLGYLRNTGIWHFALEKMIQIYKWGHISTCGTWECAGGASRTEFTNYGDAGTQYMKTELARKLLRDLCDAKLMTVVLCRGKCDCGKHVCANEDDMYYTPTSKFAELFHKEIASEVWMEFLHKRDISPTVGSICMQKKSKHGTQKHVGFVKRFLEAAEVLANV